MEEREQLTQLWEKVYNIYINMDYKFPGICSLLWYMFERNLLSHDEHIRIFDDLDQCRKIPVRYNMREVSPGVFSDSYYWTRGDKDIRKWFIQERIKDLRGICTQGTI